MDTTTLVPQASAWELIAELAVSGNDKHGLSDLSTLAQSIVDRVCASLLCPWAVLLLQPIGDALCAAHGLDEKALQALRKGDRSALSQPFHELAFAGEYGSGVLLAPFSPQQESLLTPAFFAALRHQIALLVQLHYRESASHTAQLESSRELFILQENGKIITSGLSLEAMLARITENVSLALRSDRCIIHLRDRYDPQQLFEASSYSLDQDEDVLVPHYAVNGQGPISEVLESGQIQIIGGGSSSKRDVLGFQSALLLPLKVRDQIVGFLATGYTSRDHVFSRAEQGLAQTITDQVAVAIAGSQSYDAEQRRAQELDALQDLSLRLGAEQPLEDTLYAILRGVRGFIPFAGAQICLYDAEDETFTLGVQTGMVSDYPSGSGTPERFSLGLTGWLGRYRCVLRMASFEHPPVKPLPTQLANGAAPMSFLGTPLLVGEQLIGTIELFGDQQRVFTADQERLLQLVATQAALAIASARQFSHTDTHLRGRLQHLTALQRISRQLTATLSLDLIFSFALDEALQATPATQAFIALRSDDKDGLRVTDADSGQFIAFVALHDDGLQAYRILATAGYGADDVKLLGQVLEVSDRTVGEVLTSGESKLVDELAHDDRPNGIGPNTASVLAMPVYYENQIVGVVCLHSERTQAFDHNTVEFVRALTDQVALALGNARRYEEQQRQRSLLQQRASMLKQVLDIGQALRADRSIEDLLEQIAFSIVDTTGFRRAVFYIADPDDADTLRVVSGAGVALPELDQLRTLPLPKGFIDRILNKRFRMGRCFFIPAEALEEVSAGFVVPQLSVESDALPETPDEWHPQDRVFLPLYSTSARLVGMLSVDEPYNRLRPTSRSLEAIEVLSDQAAIAIENATLLREARAQTEQMRALYKVGKAAVSTLSLDDLLDRVYTEIVSYMGTPTFFFVASYHDQHESIQFELFKEEGRTLETHTKLVQPKAGLTGHVIDSGQVLDIHDYHDAPPQLPVKPVVLDKPVRSWVGIPLRSQNRVIGVLSVQSNTAYAFTKRHIRFLSSLGNQLAIALENARLFAERERRIAELDVINDIGRITSTTLDLPKMFTQIYERIRDFLTVDAGYIYAFDETRKQVAISLEADEELRTINPVKRFLSEGSLTTQIMQTRQPLLFQNLAGDQKPSGVKPIAFGVTTRRSASWLGVPLLGNDGMIEGVISIQSYTPNLYGGRELAFMTAVASQLALGVQNVRLFSQIGHNAEVLEHKVGELSTLLEASRVLSSSLRPDEVLNRLMDVVGRHLNVSTVGLWTVTPDQMLRAAALLGISHEIADQMSVPVGQGLTGRVASIGRPLIVLDVNQEGHSLYPDFNRDHALTTFMGVPVVYREQIVGVLSVMTIEQREFSDDEQMLLAGIADQAAIALENARLFAERDRRIAELTSFNRISQRLNAAVQLDALIQIIHEEIGQVLDRRHSFIALFHGETQQISYPIFWEDGRPSSHQGSVHTANDPAISWRVINERRSVLLQTRDEVAQYLLESGFGASDHANISSWLSVPIVEGSAVFGIINVQSPEPKKFDSDDERFLITIAGLAATSIARAQLFSERERRLAEVSVLQEIGSAITSTLNLEDVLERLHAQLGRVIDVSTSFIALYDLRRHILSYPVAYDHGQRIALEPSTTRGVNHWVVTNRQPLLLGTHEDSMAYRTTHIRVGSRFGPDDKVEQSYVVVPISSGDDVLGVINIQSYQQHAFGPEDVRFVAAVANQAAVAINNARLFQERGRRIEELSTFNDIGRQFSAVPKLDDLIALIYRQASRLLDTTNFYLGLYDEYAHVVSFPIYYHNGELAKEQPLGESDSLSHYVIQSRAPLLLQGEYQAERMQELGIQQYGPTSLSWLGVPMIANDQVIGLIAIQDYERENAYIDEDVRLLSTIASWGAVALANARMFSEQGQSLQELGLLYDISMQLAGTLDATEVQQIVVLNALELLHAQMGALLLLDSNRQVTQQFMFDNQRPDVIEYPPLALPEELVTMLFSSDKPVVFRDALAEMPQVFGEGLGIHGLIGEVLGSREQPLGMLWIGDRRPRDWQGRELSMISILTTLSSQGLKTAHLFALEQARRTASDTLRTVAERLTGVLELDDIYSLLLDQLRQVVPYSSASLMLRDSNTNTVRIVATRGFPESERPEIEQITFNLKDDLTLRTIVRTKQPFVEKDVKKAKGFREVAGTSLIRAWIGVPLLLDDEVIGVLTVDSHKAGVYTEDDAQLAFTLTSQASQAVRNARLFDEVRRFNAELEQRVEERTAALAELNMQLADEKQRLQAVHAITVELTASLEMNDTLRKTLQLAAKNLGVRRGSIMLWDEQQRRLVCRAVLGDDGEVHAENIAIAFEEGTGLAGWVRDNQRPICIGDVRRDKRWVQEPGRAQDVRSVVAVPLRAEGVGTLGVLMLTSPHLHYFTPSQEQLLLTIANEVAIVIHNAELYSLVQEYATRLSESFNQQREETIKNQAILRSLGEGVVVLDEQEKVILFNPAAEDILAIREADLLGQHLGDILTYDTSPSSRSRLKVIYETIVAGLQRLSDEGQSQQRLELGTPLQTIELYFTPMVGPDRLTYGSVVVFRDITREIEADRAKRDFVSSVSHELRTPLTAIKGYVDLLVLGAAGPISETQASFLGVVKNNANRLMDLINDILEIGRIDANKIQLNFDEVDINSIFQDVMQTMRAEIERKHMQVVLEIADNLPKIEADERRITQVVLNLVSNAVKYTYAEGKIELHIQLNPSGMLEVAVTDNGVGITPEQQQNLFRRFYRADNPLRDEAGGTGLGLSIAKSFVELHGGEMWVNSEIGVGSTFSFVLPVTQPEPEEVES